MKKLLLLLMLVVTFFACNTPEDVEITTENEMLLRTASELAVNDSENTTIKEAVENSIANLLASNPDMTPEELDNGLFVIMNGPVKINTGTQQHYSSVPPGDYYYGDCGAITYWIHVDANGNTYPFYWGFCSGLGGRMCKYYVTSSQVLAACG